MKPKPPVQHERQLRRTLATYHYSGEPSWMIRDRISPSSDEATEVVEAATPHLRWVGARIGSPAIAPHDTFLWLLAATLTADSAIKCEIQHGAPCKFGIGSKQRLPTNVWYRRSSFSFRQAFEDPAGIRDSFAHLRVLARTGGPFSRPSLAHSRT